MQIKHENTSVNAESTIDGTPVEAGAIGKLFKKISNILDKFLDTIDKAIDKLGDIGDRSGKDITFYLLSNEFEFIEDEETRTAIEEQVKRAGKNAKNWPKEYTLQVAVKFIGGESNKSDTFDVYMKKVGTSDSEGLAKRNVVINYSIPSDENKCDEELVETVFDIIDKSWKNFFENSDGYVEVNVVTASIKVTLQKVTADDEVDIELISVNTPFEPDRTLEVLNNLTENADFVETLPMNEPASYDVDPEDMSFLACAEEECCDISCSIFKILGSLYQLYFDGMYVVWNAKGPNYTSIVSFADSYVWYAKGLIDQLSAYHYQLFNYAPHPATFLNACNPDACMSALNDIAILQKDLNDVVSNIDLYYCNFEGTLQECLIQAKDMFEKESNYSLARFNA